MFDSSRVDNRSPVMFVIGSQQVIAGWDEGVRGMCIGFVFIYNCSYAISTKIFNNKNFITVEGHRTFMSIPGE